MSITKSSKERRDNWPSRDLKEKTMRRKSKQWPNSTRAMTNWEPWDECFQDTWTTNSSLSSSGKTSYPTKITYWTESVTHWPLNTAKPSTATSRHGKPYLERPISRNSISNRRKLCIKMLSFRTRLRFWSRVRIHLSSILKRGKCKR